jgi:hypothetical protein
MIERIRGPYYHWAEGPPTDGPGGARMQNSTGYSRKSWKKWLAIYVVAGAIAYLIIYLLFFAHSGGGGGGGLY